MSNKFKRVQPMPIPEDSIHKPPFADLSLGLMLDRSPRQIPPGASPDLGHVRFEGGALRKEFGSTAIGDEAGAKILAIGEHKFILNNQQFHRLIRLYLEGGVLALDIWDGDGWVRVDTFADGVHNTYLDVASTQDRFVIADGSKILTWYEAATTVLEEADFPAGNSLTEEGEFTSVELDHVAVDDEYEVYFYVDIEVLNGSDYTVELEFHLNGELYTTKEFSSAGTDSWLDELVTIISSAGDIGDLIQIVVKDVRADTPAEYGETWAADIVGAAYEASKSISESPDNGTYNYRYDISVTAGVVEVSFYYREVPADPWTLVFSTPHPSSEVDQEIGFNIGDLPDTAEFRMEIDLSAGDGTLTPPSTGDGIEYSALVPGTDFNLDVHGYNETTDGDAFPGVSFNYNVPPSSTLEELSADAPGARFILPFADRLLAYRDGGDVQAAAWSSDGDITDWNVGGLGDAGATVLLDTRSDGIDALMGAAVLTSAIAVLFRQRSIMRVQETGNVALAVGHFHWIEGLGTESPFSIQATPYGILFLGHDLQVYLLTEGGPQPVGQLVHRWLVENLTSNLDKVDSVYDPVFQEYHLGVPTDNSDTIDQVLTLNIRRAIEEQQPEWRMRPLTVERFANVSVIE